MPDKQISRSFSYSSLLDEEKPSAFRKRTVILTLILAFFLGGVGILTHDAVEESLIDIVSHSLKAILDSNTAAIALWMDQNKRDVDEWASNPLVVSLVAQQILSSGGNQVPLDESLHSEQNRQLQVLIGSLAKSEDFRGFYIVNPSGVILSADNPSFIGQSLTPEAMALVTAVSNNENVTAKPYQREEFILQNDNVSKRFRILFASPIRDSENRTIAGLLIKYDPEFDFTRILSAAWMGDTGETIAFDENGIIFSRSRFHDRLSQIPYFWDSPNPDGLNPIKMLDPGVNLMEGETPDTPKAGLPLTVMAASALSKEDGMELEGYRDYRGVKVIGAWLWLEQYGFGIGTKIDKLEAFRVLRPLRLAFWGTFSLLIVCALLVLVYYHQARHLEIRIENVKQIGRYSLEEKLGQGGMGQVYKASHAMMRRPTVIKILSPDHIDQDTLARFEREVQVTSQLTHPNTISIYDYGRTKEGIFYYVMEYISGITLDRFIETEGAAPPARVIYILKQICGSLSEAHQLGVIHRDIKPPNMILGKVGGIYDFVKVLDFGLAKELHSSTETVQTMAMTIAGTPAYIAPERLLNPQVIDARVDIFSLGCVGYNLLTGKDAFEGSNAMDICHQVLTNNPIPPSQHVSDSIPIELEKIVLKCMEKRPEDRYQDVREILSDLSRIEKHCEWSQDDAKSWWEDHSQKQNEGGSSGSSDTPDEWKKTTLSLASIQEKAART